MYLTLELGKVGTTDRYVKDKIRGDGAANIDVDSENEWTSCESSIC
jgi:hypothetical protein